MTEGARQVFGSMTNSIKGAFDNVSLPKPKLPSKADVSQKLERVKTRYSGSRLQSAVKTARKGMKKGSGHFLVSVGTLAGSDKTLTKGESLKGKERTYTTGEAQFRRAKAGINIKKQLNTLVQKFGSALESVAGKVYYSSKVKSNSKLGKASFSLMMKGSDLDASGKVGKDFNKIEKKSKETVRFESQTVDVKLDMLKKKCSSPVAKNQIQTTRNTYLDILQAETKEAFEEELERIYNSDDVEAEFLASAANGKLHEIANPN